MPFRKKPGKDYRHTEETKQRIRTTLLGHGVSQETRTKISVAGKGRTAWNKGRTGVYSIEHLQRISVGVSNAQRGKPLTVEHCRAISVTRKKEWASGTRKPTAHGEANGNWRGGKLLDGWTLTQWRKSVFERDDYTCQMCFQRGGKLDADHIIPKWQAPHLIYVVSNGRTLCRECHLQTPTWGNRTENQRGMEYQIPLPLMIAA